MHIEQPRQVPQQISVMSEEEDRIELLFKNKFDVKGFLVGSGIGIFIGIAIAGISELGWLLFPISAVSIISMYLLTNLSSKIIITPKIISIRSKNYERSSWGGFIEKNIERPVGAPEEIRAIGFRYGEYSQESNLRCGDDNLFQTLRALNEYVDKIPAR